MNEAEKKILDSLKKLNEKLNGISSQFSEVNVLLDTLNSNHAKTDVKVTDIKLFLMNNGD